MRPSIAASVFIATVLSASSVIANINLDGVDYLVTRDFEELEMRRGGGASGGGHGASAASAAAAGTKSRVPPQRKTKSQPKPKSKSKPKKPKHKKCKDGHEVESRALDELVKRGGPLGKVAGHLRCPGEEHHAREFLEELMERQLELEDVYAYAARDFFEEADAYEARYLDDFDARELEEFDDLF